MAEHVILVDPHDKEIGTSEKLQAHKDGKLHRAFSIFVFNKNGEMLIQRRALTKYHCGGLWANTCCGHPRPGEKLDAAAHRRIKEELGFDCPMREQLHYTYKTSFENGLTEHEYLHVFVGQFDGTPKLNAEEVSEIKWVSVDEIKQELKQHPKHYAFWFHESMQRLF